jgi:hypothetical protein
MDDESIWSQLGTFLTGTLIFLSWLLPFIYLGEIIVDWLT